MFFPVGADSVVRNYSEQISKEIIETIDPKVIEVLKQGGLTAEQADSIPKTLKKIAEEAELTFGNLDELSLVDEKVKSMIKQKLLGVIESIAETMSNQEPDLIREAGLSEAVFSHKEDYHPILATESLATCIGLAGYDPVNNFGFVIHFTGEDEVKASGETLLGRIRAYRENTAAPLLIHLRGGVRGWSESTLSAVKSWIAAEDLHSIIASEDTLQEPIKPGVGLPVVSGSIKLDVRTGVCEKYDSQEDNPYTKMKKHDISEFKDGVVPEMLVQLAKKKPEINIVYDSKK
ncbi:hypothetical protein [Estrella lausannensis]|uniref:Uncharacterized protein n=1 Tax=Estrella lausannensis TaxID=483423 RepID=A0A0H5DSD4_9BACT|nr:hypothetical protein [Estrella lausannensis]CRX39198.1 hypothetical protein ELAC_1873 [Estrella lausannensis]